MTRFARFLLTASSLLVLCSAEPAAASPAADVDKLLGGVSTWAADFTQTIDDGHGKVVRNASGKLYLQKPGKFRWDYAEPSAQLILADGKDIWLYDKDLQQANVRSMDASLASTPAVLLSGGASVSSQFDVTALPPSGGLQWYQLIPKHSDTDFQLVRIGFDQVTQLTFTHPQRNLKLIPDLFTFVPPPGVDVIGREVK
jgi:outer membrane lipoprotein carrier protein